MAVSIVLATGFLRGVPRSSSQRISSVSMKRQSLRFPSPRGCAGTWPNLAQRTSVLLSVRRTCAASSAFKKCLLLLYVRASATLSFALTSFESRACSPPYSVVETRCASVIGTSEVRIRSRTLKLLPGTRNCPMKIRQRARCASPTYLLELNACLKRDTARRAIPSKSDA
jgi:hypothetical protein